MTWRKRTIAEMAREPEQDTIQRLSALVRAQQITIDKLEQALAQPEQPAQQEPVDSTQISKVWWDGEKLMAKPIPFVEFYKPAQRTWVGLTDGEISQLWISTSPYFNEDDFARAIEAKLKEKNTP